MKTKYMTLAGLLLAALPLTAQAQKDSTMNRTVVVENQYNPYLMEATKLNLYPAVEENTSSTHALQYARTLRGVSDWGKNEMPLLQAHVMDDEAPRGYACLAYGLHGRANAAAGYTYDLSDQDRLSGHFSLDGWNGNWPGNWRSRMARTQVGADYRHRFSQYDLHLGAEWKNSVFNYQTPKAYLDLEEWAAHPHQRFTEGDIHASLNTTDKELPLQFTIQTGLRTFTVAHETRFSEKQIHTLGDVWAPINEEQRVGVAFSMDNTFYSVKQGQSPISNFSAVGLNPYFAYETADWRIRLGVHVDPLLGGPDKGLDVAPDIRVERVFNANSVLYLQALGGREVNDFRRLTSVTPYCGFLTDVIPTYVRLNTALGFKISPVPGAWIHVFGGYQVRDHELFATLHDYAPYVIASLMQEKGKLGYGGAELKYAYKDVVDVTAKATMYHWSLDQMVEEAYLRFKPRYEWSLQAQGQVMDGLKIQAGFEYIDRRQQGDAAVQNLFTGASYDLVHRITVFARVNNLLNKEYRGVNVYPAEKLGFMVGIHWAF
jgi:hypothetical protein